MIEAAEFSSLYLITDRQLASPDLLTAIESALRGGARLIQLREKDLEGPQRQDLAIKLRRLTHSFGAKLLINDDPELALKVGADGVQLGVKSCPISAARKILGPAALIGYSAHSDKEVFAAEKEGADFASFSPIYYTPSKAQYGPPQGLAALRDLCHKSRIPIYALGGINAERIDEVLAAGACGVALISAILGQPSPETATRTILQKLTNSARG